MHEQAKREAVTWGGLTSSEKILEWVDKNQYSLIVGGWAGGLAAATSIIWKDK
jgi:hypothetical protein